MSAAMSRRRPKKRRARTSHAGVKLLSRTLANGRVLHLARWVEPDGKTREISFAPLGKTSEEARRAWAIHKARELAERRAAHAAGVEIKPQKNLADAVEDYFRGAAAEGLSSATLAAYREGSRPLQAWAAQAGVAWTQDLDGPRLVAYRKWLVGQKALVPLKGKGVGQGARLAGTSRRSPRQINKLLRSLRTILNQWRKEGLLPGLDSDGIRDSLGYTKVKHDLPRFLRAREVAALLEAARRHDDTCFALTRQEKVGAAPPGETARYQPIAPFIFASLMTGCRYAELAGLRWSAVDLEVGEIGLSAQDVKTGRARRMALNLSPALLAMFKCMRLSAGRDPYVFGGGAPLPRHAAEAARRRLVNRFGAPAFTWHDLRRTCGTYLACAPGIYAGAGAFHAAKRLGHSVTVAERYYAGVVTDIPREARTIEAAMGIEVLAKQIVDAVATPAPERTRHRA